MSTAHTDITAAQNSTRQTANSAENNAPPGSKTSLTTPL